MESSVKQRLIEFLKYKNIGQKKFSDTVGLSNGFVNSIRRSIQPDTLHRISLKFPELNTGWLITGEGEMLKSSSKIENNAGLVINGNNHINNSPIGIDNRQYFSDSPDVLRAQIELLDERIKEKDAQIKEKDAQIKQLLEILKNK